MTDAEFTAGMSVADKCRFAALRKLYRLDGVPGDIVELGVASGASLRMWGHMIHQEGLGRRLFGFDTFAGFPKLSPEDRPESKAIGKKEGGWCEYKIIPDPPPLLAEVHASYSRVAAVGGWDVSLLLLVRGRIEEALPRVAQEENIQPALILFDADLYSPTKVGLEVLWPLLPTGGICIFDNYGLQEWPGETKAVDDYLRGLGRKPELLGPEHYGPMAWIVK